MKHENTTTTAAAVIIVAATASSTLFSSFRVTAALYSTVCTLARYDVIRVKSSSRCRNCVPVFDLDFSLSVRDDAC